MNKTFYSSIFIASLIATPVSAVLLTSCSPAHKQESTGQYIDSSVITAKVKSKLLADKAVKGLAIKVNTYKNVVQLSGFVDTYQQKYRAVEITRNVPGVAAVQDFIVVKKR